jgi:hypothetical protein
VTLFLTNTLIVHVVPILTGTFTSGDEIFKVVQDCIVILNDLVGLLYIKKSVDIVPISIHCLFEPVTPL